LQEPATTVDFVAGFGNKSATTGIRYLVAVDFVADTVNFVASVYGSKATRSTLSTFNKVDRVEFNFVAGVYQALHYITLHLFDNKGPTGL